MNLVLWTDDEWSLKVLDVVALNAWDHLRIGLLLSLGEVGWLGLGELLLLLLVQALWLAEHGESDVRLALDAVDHGGGDDDVMLRDGAEWDLVDAERAVEEEVAVLELLHIDSTLASIWAGEDDADTAWDELLWKGLVLWLSVDVTLGIWADLEVSLALFADDDLGAHLTRSGVEILGV